MVASESTQLIMENVAFKANVLESGEGEGAPSVLEEIDYVNGKSYREIRK